MSRHMPNFYAGSTSGNPGEIRSNNHGNLFRYKETGMSKGMSRGTWVQIQDKKTSYDKKNADELNKLRGEVSALQKQAKKAKPKPKPKPKGDQQIEPVKHSPEIQSAKEKADAWLKGSQNDYSSIFKTDPNQNASGGFDIGGEGQQNSFDPTQYMQDYTGSGQQQKEQNAQTHEVEASAMSAQEILKRDKEQGWS